VEGKPQELDLAPRSDGVGTGCGARRAWRPPARAAPATSARRRRRP